MKNTKNNFSILSAILFVAASVIAPQGTWAQKNNAVPSSYGWQLSQNANGDGVVIKNQSNNPVEVTITNPSGSVVYKNRVTGTLLPIKARDFNTGKYNIQLQGGGETKVFKLNIL